MKVQFEPMLNYAIVEISGRQYKIEPGKSILVDSLGDIKNLDCDKVLLLSDDDKLSIGKPYLKEVLKFTVEEARGEKIRVAKFHAKANYRKVRGSRAYLSRIKLLEDKVSKPKVAKEASKKPVKKA